MLKNGNTPLNPNAPLAGSPDRTAWLSRLVGVVLAATIAQAVGAGGCTLPVQGGAPQQCTTDTECTSANVCAEPKCGPDGMCTDEPLPDGPTGDQVPGDCLRTECQGGEIAEVADPTDPFDDLNGCTLDECAPNGGGPSALPQPFGTTCEAGLGVGQCGCIHDTILEACRPEETPICQVGCTGATATIACDDQNPCTNDSCDAILWLCTREELDGVAAPESAQVAGDCRVIRCHQGLPSVAPGEEDNTDLPDDANGCTRNECVAGVPDFPPEAADVECADGGGQYCDGSGQCVQCNDHSQCGDPASNCLCRQCQDHACINLDAAAVAPGCQVPNDCQLLQCDGSGGFTSEEDDSDLPASDSNPCTTEACTDGVPYHVNNTANCNDGLYCNGTDRCSAGACTVHTGNPCPGADGDGDCSETCNENADNCSANDPNNSACNDGLYCTTTDRCNANGACVGTGNPCPGADGDGDCSETCNENADNCSANDPNNSACNDGTYCNGTDTCNASGSCANHAGDPCAALVGDCDNDCSEACSETNGNCTANEPNNTPCAFNQTCNDFCNANGECINS